MDKKYDNSQLILKKLINSNELSNEIIDELKNSYESGAFPNFLIRLVKNNLVSSDILDMLAHYKIDEVRESVALSKKTSPETLLYLADDISYSVCRKVANNENTPIKALELLSHSEDNDTRVSVAQNKKSNSDILDALYKKDEILPVRIAIARHSNTSTKTLSLLTIDTNPMVRAYVACNFHTSLVDLERLFIENPSSDEDLFILRSLAKNAKTPTHILEKIALSEYVDIREYVAFNPSASSSLLAKLGTDKDIMVRRAVAFNTSTPLSTLEVLSDDSASDVRNGVALNAKTPEHIIRKLATDKSSWVLQGVANNINTPVDILTRLANGTTQIKCCVASNTSTPVTVLRSLARYCKDIGVKECLAYNKNTPDDILMSLAQETIPIQLTVINNPNASAETLNILINSGDSYISQEAKRIASERHIISHKNSSVER